MKVLLFGATGMVGQAALRECLLDDQVGQVLAVGRRSTGRQHAKLRDIVVEDVADLSQIEDQLTGFDACLFCLGVSSLGMSETEYSRLTYDLTLSVARTLAQLNPLMTFVYVSGTGTDSTESGKVMWARVKGRTENALLQLPFRSAYMFRPGIIVPLHGVTSRTRWARLAYAATRPFLPALQALMPNYVTDSERCGRAMLAVSRHGFEKPVLEPRDINRMGA